MANRTQVGDELTEQQRKVFSLIYNRARDTGIQPSIRELMAEIGSVSPNGIMVHIRALQKKGWLGVSNRGHSRSVLILRRPDGSLFNGFADKEPISNGRAT